MEFSGAFNSIFVIKKEGLVEHKGNRCSIGSKHYRGKHDFKLFTEKVEKGDSIYLTTDGYLDQFGGEKNRKFKTSNFRKLITDLSSKNIAEQQKIVEQTFLDWKGNNDQIDDICVIGIKI